LVWRPAESGWRHVLDLTVQDNHIKHLELGDDLLPIAHSDAHSFLFPGLIDSHVHIAGDPTPASNPPPNDCRSIDDETLDQGFERVLRNLEISAKAGITSLRDMGNFRDSSLEFVRMLEEKRKAGAVLPRLFTAGGFFTRQGGHAFDRGIEVANVQDLPKLIRRLASQGATFIKLMNDPMIFELNEILVAREVTKQLGLPLVVHTYTDDAARLALDAGVDGLEHPGGYSDCTLELMKKADVFVVSTFVAALDTVVDPVGCEAETLFPDANLSIFKAWYETCCDCIPRLYRAGVRILCGTDAGFPGTDFDSLSREIAALEMLGIPLSESIKSATLYPARALGQGGLLGELEEGAYADYLVFDRNPLIGNQRLRNPVQVFCDGKVAFAQRNTAQA
jgi:imidazolonepropionase-like amidohydrolase